ncbi:pentapeptide repeat-containing protein [Kitasatospora sp. NPDC093558]|uniref:pentapeptide repeat-containing protein n=1 Tax=Kitasatospora sp. NPDC093558 TaxID=3155201 RepID=UPI003429706C
MSAPAVPQPACSFPDPDPTCPGTPLPGGSRCLEHATTLERDSYFANLHPEAPIDHRNTVISEFDVEQLRARLTRPGDHRIATETLLLDGATIKGPFAFDRLYSVGTASFQGTTFEGDAGFQNAVFRSDATFRRAAFQGEARFDKAVVEGDADFHAATFDKRASFWDVEFRRPVTLDRATFTGAANFFEARFTSTLTAASASFRDIAHFSRAKFTGAARFPLAKAAGDATFDGAVFSADVNLQQSTFKKAASFVGATFVGDVSVGGLTCADANFAKAVFEQRAVLGVLHCTGRLSLTDAHFQDRVTIQAAAAELDLRRARFDANANLQLRYATVRLDDIVLARLASIAFRTAPWDAAAEGPLTTARPDRHEKPRLESLAGVDCTLVQLADVDLTDCRFSGAFHLDQLSLRGDCTFGTPPPGRVRRVWTRTAVTTRCRFSPRSVLAEERNWRAGSGRWTGWNSGPGPDPAPAAGLSNPTPDDIVALYRQLRKGLEDGKNEPGAADFYYGEMEMRRHSPTSSRWERRLIGAYWAVSGYGIRAFRALVWLASAMALTVLLLALWGLPDATPKPRTTGVLPDTGRSITLVTDTPTDLTLPYGDRLTATRLVKALPVTFNSVVFRSSGQNLTTPGTAIEMGSRLIEPAFLALFVLALRNRVKR